MLDSEDEVPPEVIEFNKFKALGKDLLRKHKYRDGLKALEAAYGIHQSEKLSRKIKKIRDFLEEEQESSEEEEEDDGMEEISKGFKLSKHLYNQLYQYQREGISWLWGLHQKNKGGILGDDMGLGKTVQAIAFLSGLFAMRTIQTALLVMPVSLIKNWEEEIEKWAPELKVAIYHGTSQREKDSNLTKTQRRGGILLTSYGTLLSSIEKLSRSTKSGSLFKWDYFILDEGHKIKNPTGTTKAAHEIKANHRVVLTGTPIQNNLKELWALYDFCHQGSLLGTLSTFRIQYENPINKSREKDASAGQKRFGTRIAENLRNLIGPYFLRRTKQETIDKENYNPDGTKRECAQLTKKNEFILWLYLSPKQIELYNDFLMSDEVKSILSTSRSPLVHLNVLKKVCDHPRLFTKRICAQVGLDGSNNDDSLNDSTADQVSLNVSPTLLLQESGKMEALITLLNHLRETGHRTLVFSMSRKILDIIQKILSQSNWKIMRLDGTVTKMDERQARIKKFQTNSTYSVFLLTTQVGGVGLTLTAADRVVIYDPSWNPATDAQAVDRAYRIGQTRNVVVYRFITCGTIEEKIYRRQIFKDSITRQATCKGKQDNDPHRYFTKSELRELFVLDDPRCSKTQEQLQEMHAAHRKTTPELIKHIAFLERNMEKHVFGISDHDLMFRGNMPLEDVTEVQYQSSEKQEAEFIERQVQMAQEQIQLESRKNEELATVLGSYKTKFISDANKPTKFGERNTDMLPGANNTNFQFNRPALPKSLWIDGAQDDELVIINNLDDDEEDSLIKNVEIRKQESPTSELKKSFHNFSINVDDYPVRMTPPKPKVINIKPDISNIKPDISNMSYFERIKLENEFDEKKPISVEDIKREHSVSRSVHASSDGAQLNTKLPKTSSPTLYKYFSVLKKSPSSSQILNSTEVLARDSDEEVVEISDSEEEIEDVISPEKSNNIVIEDSFDSIRDKIVLDLPNVQPIVPQSSERSVIESSFAGIEDEDCLELPIVYPISPRGSVKSVSDSFTGLEDEDTFELPNVKPSNSILNSTAFNSKKRASPVFELDASLEGSKLQLDESASFEIKAPYKRQKNNVIESDSE